jgi:hypothetical protein
MDGDTCRLCHRQVIDISGLTDQERVALMEGCADEICVSYKFPLRPAIAAALTIAALGAPMAAAAQEVAFDEEEIMVGGITDPAQVVYISDAADAADAAVPELPVVHDNQTAALESADAAAAADGQTSSQPVDAEQARPAADGGAGER